jgi:hypothetical protein
MRLKKCRDLQIRPHDGAWFRALNLRYWKRRLATDHTREVSSRFSVGSRENPAYRTLYLGSDHQVVLFEVRRLLGSAESPIPDPKGSFVIMSLELRLSHVVDLCDEHEQRLLGTNRQELTGNWANHNGIAPTQKLGAALYDVEELEGVIFPSSLTEGRNLLVFPDKLGSFSSIHFLNEIDGRREFIR